jgi:hypothetical protein
MPANDMNLTEFVTSVKPKTVQKILKKVFNYAESLNEAHKCDMSSELHCKK